MMGLISLTGLLAIVLMIALPLALIDRGEFDLKWLLIALGLIAVNDLLLTNIISLLPDAFPNADWNWQGKLLALTATLAIAALPQFGWKNVGLTLRQAPGSLKAVLPLVAAYALFFVGIALAFPTDDASIETVAFQLTMPSLDEEAFYRGTLLFALYQAFGGQAEKFGVHWTWGALLSCIVFGLGHSFGYSDDGFAFDPIYFALTGGPSLLAVWLRLRTGSLLLPIAMHSVGNSLPLLL